MTAGSPGSILRIVIGAAPALVTVIFAGIVAVIALALDKDRRQYALDFVDCCIELSAVLVGVSRVRPCSLVGVSWARPSCSPVDTGGADQLSHAGEPAAQNVPTTRDCDARPGRRCKYIAVPR